MFLTVVPKRVDEVLTSHHLFGQPLQAAVLFLSTTLVFSSVFCSYFLNLCVQSATHRLMIAAPYFVNFNIQEETIYVCSYGYRGISN